MDFVRWVSIALLTCIISACAPHRVSLAGILGHEDVEAYGPHCTAHFSPRNHAAEASQVDAALKELLQRQKTDFATLQDRAGSSASDDVAGRFYDLADSYHKARDAILEPLAQRGNADAMYRLSDGRIRESDAPADVSRWFALVSCSAELGHPLALSELVRWYWHQRGDGSIRQVQANRAAAFTFADRAAKAGNMFGVSRIATYVAGDIHQYPANLNLGRRLMLLCARTGDRFCGQQVAGEWGYDLGLGPVETFEWVSRAAQDEPERFARREEIAGASLTPGERESAHKALAAWLSTPWVELRDDWEAIEADILAYGETSTGALPTCDTASPWCRTVTNRVRPRVERGR